MSKQERFKTCEKCGYQWLARTANPPKCPNCQEKYTVPISNENQGVKVNEK
jgi:rubrerythrin